MRIELKTDDGRVFEVLRPFRDELWQSSAGELVNMVGSEQGTDLADVVRRCRSAEEGDRAGTR
jgi:hypothetical protein